MMAFLKRILHATVEPVTHLTVTPADRDPEKERELKVALNDLVHATVTVERRSWEIHRELAGNALRLVSGET